MHRVCENQRCCFVGGIVVLSAARRGHPGRSKALTGFWLDAAHVSQPTAGGWKRMEPRRREKEAGPSRQKKNQKNKQLLSVSVFECFLCFLSGFRDPVIHFKSAGSRRLLTWPLRQRLWLLLLSVSHQMASGWGLQHHGARSLWLYQPILLTKAKILFPKPCCSCYYCVVTVVQWSTFQCNAMPFVYFYIVYLLVYLVVQATSGTFYLDLMANNGLQTLPISAHCWTSALFFVVRRLICMFCN